MTDWKEKYIELLKKLDEDICEKCVHNRKCEGEKCEHYVNGTGGYLTLPDGATLRKEWEWDCRDFEHGTCLALENTPCNGCLQGNCIGFELKDSEDEM